MSLWFVLTVNEQPIGSCEIQRREPLDLADPAVVDAVSTYDVRIDGRPVCQVRHRYGDGAWALLRLALNAGAPDAAGAPS